MPTTTTRGARYGAYHRVSDANGRDLEAETTITDKEAFDQMDGWAAMRPGVTIVERYLDWDHTGAKMSRPELDRMLADLDEGRIDGIVVAQVDRLSRADVGDALAVVKQIAGDDEGNPRPLVLLDLGIDPSTEFGEFGLTILLALARMQWRRYKRQYAAAQKRAVARGLWMGPDPLGYRKTELLNAKTDKLENGPLEPSDEAPIITEAFKIAGSQGLHAVAAYLEEKVPDQRWRTSDVRRILRNRVYLGEIRHGALVNPGTPDDPKPHPALTTPDLFALAQTEPKFRRTPGDYPLSGIATCARCGKGAMVGALQTVEGRTYRRMRCSNPDCPGNSINADSLEAYVKEQLREALADQDVSDLFHPEGVAEAREEYEAAKARLLAYVTKTDPTRADYEAGRDAHDQAVEDAEDAYRVLAGAEASMQQLPSADELDDPATFEAALRAMVARIIVKPGGRGGPRLTTANRVVLLAVHNGHEVAWPLAA